MKIKIKLLLHFIFLEILNSDLKHIQDKHSYNLKILILFKFNTLSHVRESVP